MLYLRNLTYHPTACPKAILQAINLKDKNNKLTNVALGFPTLEG
jgi:energy-coupling factor transport system ATP-binding protein